MCMSQLFRRMYCVRGVDEATAERRRKRQSGMHWNRSANAAYFFLFFVFIDFLFRTNVEPLKQRSHTVYAVIQTFNSTSLASMARTGIAYGKLPMLPILCVY